MSFQGDVGGIGLADLQQSLSRGREGVLLLQGDDGQHFAAEVIDDSSRVLNRVQQQRAVYASLKGLMDGANGALHALALTTKAPE